MKNQNDKTETIKRKVMYPLFVLNSLKSGLDGELKHGKNTMSHWQFEALCFKFYETQNVAKLEHRRILAIDKLNPKIAKS